MLSRVQVNQKYPAGFIVLVAVMIGAAAMLPGHEGRHVSGKEHQGNP